MARGLKVLKDVENFKFYGRIIYVNYHIFIENLYFCKINFITKKSNAPWIDNKERAKVIKIILMSTFSGFLLLTHLKGILKEKLLKKGLGSKQKISSSTSCGIITHSNNIRYVVYNMIILIHYSRYILFIHVLRWC